MRKIIKLSLLSLSLAAATCQAALPVEVNNQAMPSLAPMLQHTMPAIVNITTQGHLPIAVDPFDQPASTRGQSNSKIQGKRFESIGSGVIVDAKQGLILTNAHITDQAKVITVTLNDGRRYRAKLIGQDIPSDVAVLQIHAPNLTAIEMADSNKLQVGDFVVAIGSPFGLNQSVTSGVVSGVQRNNLGIEGYENFIQTDASINPGNSGGALVNLQGELVGINTAILAPNGGNIGIGFAIPSDMAYAITQQLIKYGSVGRGVAGIMMQTLTPELADAMHTKAVKGALISQVTADSPANKAGLKVGDIVQKIDGSEIADAGQVRNAIGLTRAGTKVQIQILRGDKTQTVNLITEDPRKFEVQNRKSDPFLYGLVMSNYNAQAPLLGFVQGVKILHLDDSTPAWQSGLRAGDIITSANMKPVRNLQDLRKIANDSQHELLLNIYRNNGAAFFVIKV